jgi:2-iminobutanoate/2-iminopropanoate deaminase
MTDKKAIFPEGAHDGTPYSPGIVSGGFLFIAGQVGEKADGSMGATIEEQTQLTLQNMRAVLNAAGCDFKDLVKVNVFVTDKKYFSAFNEIYKATIPEPRPTRATIVTELVDDSFMIEIEGIAKLP